jgi:hypothetical protein
MIEWHGTLPLLCTDLHDGGDWGEVGWVLHPIGVTPRKPCIDVNRNGLVPPMVA